MGLDYERNERSVGGDVMEYSSLDYRYPPRISMPPRNLSPYELALLQTDGSQVEAPSSPSSSFDPVSSALDAYNLYNTGAGFLGGAADGGMAAYGNAYSGALEGMPIIGNGGTTTAAANSGYLGGATGSLLGAAGLAAGAYTGYQQFKGAKNVLKGGDLSTMQQIALALPTFGASFAYNPIKKKFFDKNRWKTEKDNIDRLVKGGTYIPQNLIDSMPTRGRTFDEMERKDFGGDYIGFDSKGNWVNNKFNKSRNVADLRAHDIVNFSTFAKNDPEWFKKSLDERLKVADEALKQGTVSEGRGEVKVDWSRFKPAGSPQPMPKPSTPMQAGMIPASNPAAVKFPQAYAPKPKQPMQAMIPKARPYMVQ